MALHITTSLAAVLAFILVWLSWATIMARVKHDTDIGDAGIDAVRRAVRGHGNFTEYAPLALALVGLLEYQGAPRILVAALAVVFVTGRILHPFGIRQTKSPNFARVVGFLSTLLVLVVGAGYALYMTWA